MGFLLVLVLHPLKKDPPVHGLRLHVSEPNPQVWGEVLPRQLQHGDVPPAVQLRAADRGSGVKLRVQSGIGGGASPPPYL